ncbi:hypothetical protein [Nocardia sp. NBC_01327]|uniref:hypothetical protein n=1 Tax=Nocardia sp. NBC_01327 TaxID=2903593 RepID=UPI002E160B03|nr:hypothetical protein OG326_42540 [Nocardia sp. NBC_01327]
MVNLTCRRGRHIVIAALVAVLAVLGPAASASADPDPSGGAGTFGFNTACDQLQQGLDGIGISGLPSLGDVVGDGCKIGNVVTHPEAAATAAADKAWDSSFGKVVSMLLGGLAQGLVISLTWWTKIPTSDVVSQSDLFGEIRAYTFQLQILCLAGSMIMCAIRLAMAHRSGAAAEATETFRVLARSVFASAIFSTVLVLGTQAGDAFSDWVINAATHNDAKGAAEAILQTQTLMGLSPGLVFVIVIVGMIGALAQAVFAVVREALLVLVVGILPLAAASSGTHTGKGFYEKLTAWSLAFVLYKPIAALVYMIAFKTAGTGGTKVNADLGAGQVPSSDDAQRALVGVVLLCSAALVLPAVMRLVSPLTSMGTGISGAAIGAGAVGSAAGWAMSGANPTGAASSSSGNAGGPSRGGPPGGGGGGGGGGGTRPTGAPKPSGGGGGGSSGSGGSSGVKGAAGTSGAAKVGGSAAAGGGAAAAGPAGAIAAGAVKAVRSAHRSMEAIVGSAASPVARPSGAGSAAVPR